MNQKIAVVTGANGFVGSHLIDFLLEKNYHVKAIVRYSSNTQWIDSERVELLKIGLDNIDELVKAFEGVNYIFHIAGIVKGNKQKDFDKGNVTLTYNVLEAATKCKKEIDKIVVTSSLAAIGPSTIENPLSEDLPCNPVSMYGISKLKQEKLIANYQNRLSINVIRPPVVYGERDTEVLTFFKSVNNRLIPVAGFKEKKLSLIYIKDLVNALFLMAISDVKSETFFVAEPEEITWFELGKKIEESLGKTAFLVKLPHWLIKGLCAGGEVVSIFAKNKPPMNNNKYKEIIQPAWTCSSAKAKKMLNFKPKYSLQEGIDNTIAWYKENDWL